MGDRGRFPYRTACKYTVLLEMGVEGCSIVVIVGWEVFQYLKKLERYPNADPYALYMQDLDSFGIFRNSIALLGIIVALFLLITGVRVLIGPLQLSRHVDDLPLLKAGVKVCSLWTTFEFLRFILLLLGLSIRLMVFSLLAFDEFTNTEILKQATVLVPLSSSLGGMIATSKYGKELEAHAHEVEMALEREKGLHEDGEMSQYLLSQAFNIMTTA